MTKHDYAVRFCLPVCTCRSHVYSYMHEREQAKSTQKFTCMDYLYHGLNFM